MNDSRKYVGIEQVLNIYEPSRVWYYIPGYNGYEVSNDGYLRSMKHYRRYPYGIMINPIKMKDGSIRCPQDPIFELSDNNNERQRIHLSQLMHLALTNPYTVSGYPRATIITDTSSRNDRHFVKKSIKIPPIDNTAHYAKFTIISDGEEVPGMTLKEEPDYTVPLVSTRKKKTNRTFFGRSDCVIQIPED